MIPSVISHSRTEVCKSKIRAEERIAEVAQKEEEKNSKESQGQRRSRDQNKREDKSKEKEDAEEESWLLRFGRLCYQFVKFLEL